MDLPLSAARQTGLGHESYPTGRVAAVEAVGARSRLDRTDHRKWHLDRIGACLARHRAPI